MGRGGYHQRSLLCCCEICDKPDCTRRLCIYSYDKSESDAGSPQLALQTHLISRGTLYRVRTYVLRTKTYVL